MTAALNTPVDQEPANGGRQAGAPWSLADAAVYLGLCRATIERAARDGRIKATRFGRRVTISDIEMQRLIAEGF